MTSDLVTSNLLARQARLAISPELLKEMLYLPDDAEIFSAGVTIDPDGRLASVYLHVGHPDLPALSEGETPPTVTPTYEMTERPQAIRMIDWGLA